MSEADAAAAADGPAGAPETLHVEVPRTARLQVVGDPATAHTCWIALHGYGQLAAYFVRPFAAVRPDGHCVVAPEALSRFYLQGNGGPTARIGATWMTREDREAEIADYVRYLDLALDAVFARRAVRRGDDVGLADPLRVHVLGFSQGATTACRWLAHRRAAGRPAVGRLVLWGGGVPPEFDEGDRAAVLRETPLTLVVGDADEYVTAEAVADQEARLARLGVPYRLVRYAGTHRIPPEELRPVLAGA